jgi:O-antigen ligase
VTQVLRPSEHIRSRTSPESTRAPSLSGAAAPALVALAGAAVGVGLHQRPDLSIAFAVGAFALAVAVTKPELVLVAVAPACFVVSRVAGGLISVADVAIVLGAVAALPHVAWPGERLRACIRAAVVYEIMLLPVLAAHPDLGGIFEWLHRASLVGGSLLIGSALVELRILHRALGLLLLASCVVAAIALSQTLAAGLAPAYPFGLQKNFAGAILAVALLVTLAGRPILAVPPWGLGLVRVVLSLGLLATRSRGAMVGVLAGFVVHAVFTHRRSRSFTVATLVMGVAFAAFVLTTVSTDLAEVESSQFNTISSRETFQTAAWNEWLDSPILGQGLRFFDRPQADLQSDPHNVVYLSLAEGGLLGLVALAILVSRTLGILKPMGLSLSAVAAAVVAARLAHGLFDVYWVAGSQALPWILVGAAATSDPGRSDEDAPVANSQLTGATRG